MDTTESEQYTITANMISLLEIYMKRKKPISMKLCLPGMNYLLTFEAKNLDK